MIKIEEEQDNKENCFSYEICTNWDIKWQFDLRKQYKQETKKETSHIISNSDETVQNKVEQAINKLEYCYYEKKYDNNSTSTTPIVPKSEQKRVKLIRKMAEKAFKAFKMKLTDISKELSEDKNNMKLWFRKKLDSAEDNARILDKCTKWIHNKLTHIDFEDFAKIVHKYTKSCQKEEAKRYKIPDPSLILKKSFVLYPAPPGEKYSKNAHLLLHQTCNAENTQNLVHLDLELNVNKHVCIEQFQENKQNDKDDAQNQDGFWNEYPFPQNSTSDQHLNGHHVNGENEKQKNGKQYYLKHKNNCFIQQKNGVYVIREKILWDFSQIDEKYILQNAYYLVRDIIFEYELKNLTKESIQELWVSVCKQIYEQLHEKRSIQENSKIICQFNSQEALNSQKEHIIQIGIVIKNKQQQVIHKEQIEWDIMSDINSAESFAEILVQDLGLEKNYVHDVSKQIRDQIMTYMTKKAEKISKFYPEFNKTNTSENWNRVKNHFNKTLYNTIYLKNLVKEKEFMKKKLVFTISEDIPLIPDEYVSDDFPQFKNQEMFNLIKNNLDVMPPKFQDKLIAIEKIEVAQKKIQENDTPFINIDKAMRLLDPKAILHDNPYVPQILRENRHINDLELELDKKRAVFNNPLLAAQMS